MTMQKLLRLLVAMLILAVAAGPIGAEAAPKKKAVAAKKHKQASVKKAAFAKKVKHAKKRERIRAVWTPGMGLMVRSAAAVVVDQTTGTVLY